MSNLHKLRSQVQSPQDDALDDIIIAKIKRAWRIAGHYAKGLTYERWEASFLGVAHPDQEADYWGLIADAMQLFQQRHNDNQPLDDELGGGVLSMLLLRVMGMHKEMVGELQKLELWNSASACWESVGGKTFPIQLDLSAE